MNRYSGAIDFGEEGVMWSRSSPPGGKQCKGVTRTLKRGTSTTWFAFKN